MGAKYHIHWFSIATASFFAVGLISWALASPSGSAPDEDQHVANIYCLHDASTCRSNDWAWPWSPWWAPDPADRRGPEYSGAKQAYRDLWEYQYPRSLPCYVTNGSTWYAPDAKVPATCLDQEAPDNNQPATLDILSRYPNVYYRFMSLFTGDTIRESVVTWRLLNVVMAIVMITVSLLLSARTYRRPIAVGTLVASMPLGLFLASSTNPSGWLLVGTASFFGPAITVLRERSSTAMTVGRLAFLLLCLLMMVAGRVEGIGHAAVLVAVALMIGLKAPKMLFWLLGAAASLVGILAILVPHGSVAAKIQNNWGFLQQGLDTGNLWDPLMSILGFFFGTDAIRLGWLDVVPPSAAIVAVNAAFWGATVLGLAVMFRRKALALVVVAGLLIAVPAALTAGGWDYPPTRYFLPLVYMLAFVFLVPEWGRYLPRWSNAQWIALGAALSIANSLSLLWLTVRYVSGIQPGTTNPRSLAAAGTPEWWWGAWLSPFWNWMLGTVAFAVGVGLLFSLPSIRVGSEDMRPAEEPEPADDPYHDFWNPPGTPQVDQPAPR